MKSTHIFRVDQQERSTKPGLEIRVAHFPPQHSRYKLIELRFFPNVTRICPGILLNRVETTEHDGLKTETTTALKIEVHRCETGCYYLADFKK